VRTHDAGVPLLTVETRDAGGHVTVVLAGELDLEDTQLIERSLDEAIARAGRAVTVDLRGVTFVGSTGVRLLLAGHERAGAAGVAYRLAVGEGPARRVVELLELHRRLEVVTDPDAPGAPGAHIDPRALDESLDGLGALALGAATVEEGLERVLESTKRLFSVSGAGLMMTDTRSTLRYVVASDAPARALEAAQEELGEGPCVECLVQDRVIVCTDLATDERWPRLGPLVAPHGVRAVLGVPTRIGGTPVGSLNVYRDEPYEWDDSDVAAIAAFNGVVESLLGSAIAAHRRGRVVAQLQEALDKRIVIERAVGLLMGRHGIDAVRAFDVLRRAARSSRRTVGDVAQDVLGGLELTAGR
jgi:anti-anti-sigma factor